MPNIKPILFDGDMVQALLDNRKTVTRRVVNPQPRMVYYDGKLQDSGEDLLNGKPLEVLIAENQNGGVEQIVPPYQPSSIMYVQETWCKTDCFGLQNGYVYKANDNSILEQTGFVPKWRSPVCMPREAARIFLRVKNVRVEHLQDITEAEIFQDTGEVQCTDGYDWFKDEFKVVPYSEKFKFLLRAAWGRYWDEHIVKMREEYIWEANPWVFVISFERISKEEAYGECKQANRNIS